MKLTIVDSSVDSSEPPVYYFEPWKGLPPLSERELHAAINDLFERWRVANAPVQCDKQYDKGE